MYYGLDLSEHNGNLDFNEIKKNHQFVILRCGYGSLYHQKDKKFDEYYKQAKSAGLKIGVYLYGYSLTEKDSKGEAEACLKWIKGKQLDMPVFYDMEDDDGYKSKHGMPNNATLVKICDTFCDIISKAGYETGVYASEYWFDTKLKGINRKYHKWVAKWGLNDGNLHSNENQNCDIHQYTSEYYIGTKRFDRNIAYTDYFEKKKTTVEIADEVIAGKWGNGADRKKKLTQAGYNYDKVQAYVNAKLGVGKSINQLAKEVIAGKWSNGADRKKKLTQAGYDYDKVQKEVNKLLK